MTSFPKKIYKYQAFTAQNLHNLKSQVLYFGSPLNFNDPYDCALKVDIENPSNREVESIRELYLNKNTVPQEIRMQLEKASIETLRIKFMNGGITGLKEHTESFLKTKGVSCFSECNDNLLMWSHYGGSYKGFCLEFSTETEPFNKIYKVEYTAKLPKVGLASILVNDSAKEILKLFCTKSLAWSYEREWRAIHVEAGTRFVYPPQSLTGIYFGPDIDVQSKEIVCLILKGQNEYVKFWNGSRSASEFKVNFEPFTYSSFLEAKRMGLR